MLNHHTMMIHCLISFNEAKTIIYQKNGRMKSIEINSFSYHVARSVCITRLHLKQWQYLFGHHQVQYLPMSSPFYLFSVVPLTVTAVNTARVLPNIKSIFHRFWSITGARIRGVASFMSMCVCNADLFLITFFNEILWTNLRGLKFNSMHRHQVL